VQWAILRGDDHTGTSVIQMTPGLDAGPCLAQESTPIGPDEDAAELEARLAVLGAALVMRVIDQLAAGTAKPIEQDTSQASKAPRLAKDDGAIDWSRPALEIKNLVRAVRPWPRAFTFWRRSAGEPLRLNIDRVQCTGTGNVAAEFGAVVNASGRLLVSTGEGMLEILELQPAGKRAMSAAEFLRGNPMGAGDRLGPMS
jgi:methionyl-tRNA formyltransferase